MRILLILLFKVLLFIPAHLQAVIVENICIKKIGEIRNLGPIAEMLKSGLKEGGIAVFDWDQTISAKEGNYAVREPDTLPLIHDLQEAGFATLVETSRLGGLGLAGNEFTSADIMAQKIGTIVGQMTSLLGAQWLKHGALRENKRSEYQLQGGDPLRKHLITDSQIVFAGGDYGKGGGLIYLLDKEDPALFKNKVETIIFVDNSKEAIENMASKFKERPEKVYLFHYPNPAPMGNDEPCK